MIMTAIPENGMVHLSSRAQYFRNLAKIGIPGLQPEASRYWRALTQRRRRQGWAEDGVYRTLDLWQPHGEHAGDDRASNTAPDLPLKALVWQDADGRYWLSYHSPEYLKQRHNIPDDLLENISGIRAIAEEADARAIKNLDRSEAQQRRDLVFCRLRTGGRPTPHPKALQ